MNQKTDTSVWVVARWAALILAVAVVIGVLVREVRGQTPDEWFLIAVQIQAHEHELDADERRFIKNVVNRLTVNQDAVPTPEHRMWLLHLKERFKIK